jgi:hypothetical protein
MIATASGCGGGHSAAVRSAYTSITRSHAHAVARALTIRVSDLPEFKVTAHPATAQEGQEAADEVNCVRPAARRGSAPRVPGARSTRTAVHARRPGHRGTPSQRPWGYAKSDVLAAGSGYHALGAFSGVSIMPTAAAARLSITQSVNLDQACMEHALRRGLLKSRLRVRGVVTEPLSVAVPGADASVAYQTVVGVRGAPLVLYMDLIFFSYGQDVVTLTTYHSSKPVPRSMEERLLGLLVARARAHTR